MYKNLKDYKQMKRLKIQNNNCVTENLMTVVILTFSNIILEIMMPYEIKKYMSGLWRTISETNNINYKNIL